MMEIILSRIPSTEKENMWIKKLLEVLQDRKQKRLKKKKEILLYLTKYTELAIEGIEKIGKGKIEINLENTEEVQKSMEDSIELCSFFSPFSRSILSLIGEIIDNKEKYTVVNCREYLIKALHGFNSAIEMQTSNRVHLMSKIGGTAITQASFDENLPDVEPPYLPAIDDIEYEYTPVLDLDETLVHYYETENEGKCLIRPNAEYFLKEMSQYYELVIFTAALQDYADWIIDQIDPEGYIKYRLYRHHALPGGSIYIKDLSRIGREMSKTIIVDNVPENFQLQPDNGIFITSWFDDVNDTALEELSPILIEIARKGSSDVREALRKMRDQMIEQISQGIAKPILSLDS